MPALDRPAPSTRSVGRTAPPTAAVHRHNGRNRAQITLFHGIFFSGREALLPQLTNHAAVVL